MNSPVKPTFEQACAQCGLDPQETPVLKLASVLRGVTDRELTALEIACIDYKMPEGTTAAKLASHILGSEAELSNTELVKKLGINWTATICDVPWLPSELAL